MDKEIIKNEYTFDYFKEETLLLRDERNKLKDKERTQRLAIEYAIEKIMHSNMPIGEAQHIVSILNYPEDDTCKNDSVFYSKRLTNQELRRILNII